MNALREAPRLARLVQSHFQDLQASGLATETIMDAGIYSASGREVEALLGYGAGPGMVIPYDRAGANGTPTYARVKLDHAGADGKRYRSPKGRGNHLYIPFAIDRHALCDVGHGLVITEGEKKTLAAVQTGLICVGLAGVWSWRHRLVKDGPSVPIDDLHVLPWSHRRVVIVLTRCRDQRVRARRRAGPRRRAHAARRPRHHQAVAGASVMAAVDTKVGLDDFLKAHDKAAFDALPEVPALPVTPTLKIMGMGTFVAQRFPEAEPLIEGILSDDGGGWLGGEEKTNKTWWMEAEATSLALAKPLAGRFTVPQRRRALILEEEDSPRRTHRRVRAVLRGHGVDPDDPAVQKDLDAWLRISVWSGFTLDNALLVAQFEAAIKDFKPAVVYIDCLRKVTLKNLNHADEAGALLAILDDLRRRYNVVFRLVHHFRKQQGFRTGRGSQEIGGSFVLGAWGENSLFFEPIGRKQGAVRVEVQTKDGAPVPGFTLKLESEGPSHNPILVRLVAKEDVDPHAADEVVYQAVATLPKQEAVKGEPGVSVQKLMEATKLSESTVRRALKNLIDAERCIVTGTMTKQAKLYGVNAQ